MNDDEKEVKKDEKKDEKKAEEKWCLFNKGIEPSDVNQGGLGDCWWEIILAFMMCIQYLVNSFLIL